MKVFIVYAHPEPKSFNSAMKDLAVKVLTGKGHEVKVSDLYNSRFNPVASRNDFLEIADPDFFKYQLEQKNAFEKAKFSEEIRKEQEKLLWANMIVLQFPLWWFSLPAILKGWVDKVFAYGFSYGMGKLYDEAPLKGRKGMLAITTGGPENMYRQTGPNGDINQLLYHINHGMLYFVGMDVLPPYVAYSVAHVGQKKREEYLKQYEKRLLTLETTKPISFPRMCDFDENMQLRRTV